MASDSQTVTATTAEKPLENKVNDEAKLMEKETVLPETADVLKDKPVSDSNLTVTKEEQIDKTPTGEPEKESSVVVEETAGVVKAEESTEKVKDENGDKVAEQVEPKEPTFVKEGVESVDVEKGEEKGKDQNGEEKVVEQVELNEPTLVKEAVEEVKLESVDAEKAEEKRTVESVAEEDNKDKEKIVGVSESTDEAIRNRLEPVDVSTETAEDKVEDVEVLEVKPKPEASENVVTQSEKAKELVEVVEAEETEQLKVEFERNLEERIVETEDSSSALCPEEIVKTNQDSDTVPKKETERGASSPVDVIEKAITGETYVIDEPSKDEDEKASESVSALCTEKTVPINQESETNPEKETEGDIFSPADVIEKVSTEKHVVEEPTKDERENVSEAKDIVTKLATEVENIKKEAEPAAEDRTEETLKEADTESKEKETEANKQDESVTAKVSEVVETAPDVKEGDEPKQQTEVTAKEVSVKQKYSNSIMSKVKQSFVKAKKAIIGKSPSSKTISTEEAKEENKVK